MIHYPGCPVCKSGDIHFSFKAKDHTVSGKMFEVWTCKHCTALFTQDIPEMEEMGSYYQSDKYISHSDTDRGFVNRLYHVVRKYTLQSKKNLICKETGLKQGNILDIGSGTGAFLDTMKNTGWNVTGLEPGEEAREKGRTLYNVHSLPSQELFNLQAGSFDAITLWHVLEHVHQLHAYVEQVKKLMTDKGVLFIAVPNYTSHDASHYQEGWAAYDVPRHLYHFSPLSINMLMKQHGLRTRKMIPMWFDSYYVSMLSEQYKKGGMLTAMFTGLVSSLKTMADKKRSSSLIYVIEKIN